MYRHRVESSTLRTVGYHAATRTLEVEFTSGRVYRYLDVPQRVFDELMAAPSKGYLYNVAIRDSYRHVEVTPAQ